MIQECKFNPACDVEEVVPDLAPDISEMMITHTVPATSSTDTPYTNETKIEEVGHYLRDKIEVAMAQYRLNEKISAGASATASANTGSTSGEQA